MSEKEKFWVQEGRDAMIVIEAVCRMARDYDLNEVEVEYQTKTITLSIKAKRWGTAAN